MLNAFYNPEEAILDAKKLGGWVSTVALLIITAVLFAVSPMIILKSFAWKLSLIVLGASVVGYFLGGLFLKISLSILGAKSPGYWESLTSIVYGAAPFSAAVLVGSLLFLIPKAGMPLAALALVIGLIAMTAAQIRAVKELAAADLLTTLVALWIVASVGMTSAYIAYVFSIVAMLTGML